MQTQQLPVSKTTIVSHFECVCLFVVVGFVMHFIWHNYLTEEPFTYGRVTGTCWLCAEYCYRKSIIVLTLYPSGHIAGIMATDKSLGYSWATKTSTSNQFILKSMFMFVTNVNKNGIPEVLHLQAGDEHKALGTLTFSDPKNCLMYCILHACVCLVTSVHLQ